MGKTKEKKEVTEYTLDGLLKMLTKPPAGKTFEEFFPEVWEEYAFKTKPNSYEFENMLIDTIKEIYCDKEDRWQAIKRDFSFLMFGLLKGYYHTIKSETGSMIDNKLEYRYRRYLIYSDYVSINYPGQGTYEEIEVKNKTSK